MSSFPFFLASGIIAFVVIVRAMVAWLDDEPWELATPRWVQVSLVATWLLFCTGCVVELL